jgi:hypothetical protein
MRCRENYWRDRGIPLSTPMRRYTMGAARHMVSHVVGSTSMFMNVVNAIVAGVLGALIANAANATPTLTAIIGSLSALAYFFVMLAIGRRTFAQTAN